MAESIETTRLHYRGIGDVKYVAFADRLLDNRGRVGGVGYW